MHLTITRGNVQQSTNIICVSSFNCPSLFILMERKREEWGDKSIGKEHCYLFLLVEQDELAIGQDAVLPLPNAGLRKRWLAAGQAVAGRPLHICAQGTEKTPQNGLPQKRTTTKTGFLHVSNGSLQTKTSGLSNAFNGTSKRCGYIFPHSLQK